MSRSLRILTVVILFEFQAGMSAVGAYGQDAVTLGAFLSIGMGKIQQLLREAQESGRVLAIEAGIQAQNVITQTQAAYQASLSKTIQQLDQEERRVYLDVVDLMARLEKGANSIEQDTLQRAQTIVNSLPFAQKFPQLRSFHPPYVLPTIESYRVRFVGNFPYAFKRETIPTLEVAGKRFPATQYDNTGLTFDIPATLLGLAEKDAARYSHAVISIPWDSSTWYNWFWSKPSIAQYGFDFVKLPSSPGSYVLEVQHAVSRQEYATRVSEEWKFDSHQDDIEETKCASLSGADQANGWRIVHDGAGVDVSVDEGEENQDWWNRGQQSTSDVQVCWRMRTEHHAWDDDGKIRWRIRYRITRSVESLEPTVVQDNLSWASTKILETPTTNWILKISWFDGTEYQFNKSDVSRDLFQVSAAIGTVTLKTFGQ